MSRSIVRRLGALLLGASLAVTGLATPAQAADTGTVTGRLTDGEAGVAGGSVSIYGDSVSYQDTAWLDSVGNYTFEAVPPGTYRVNFRPENRPAQYAYGKTDWPSANLITVTAGGTTVVNDEVLPVGTITGRLVDRAGAGVPWAPVSVEAVDYSSYGYTSTDWNGEFTVQTAPGSYRVRFDLGQFSQYANGTLDRDAAAVFTVTAGGTVTVNDTLIATGSLTGRFTDASGTAVPWVDVNVTNGDYFGTAQTDEDGRYRFDQVPVGSGYTVEFANVGQAVHQYAYGTVNPAAAARFAVTEGQTVTVDDQRLPTGSVRLTAVDARTGAAIQNFTSGIDLDARDTENGEVVYPALPVGTHEIWALATGYAFDGASVTVVAGEQAEVRLVMEPMARFTATVVDAATGEPLPGVCIVPVRVQEVRMPDGCGDVTDASGKVTQMFWKGPGTYQLLAWPLEADGFGAQWVGSAGGTGDLRRAQRFVVEAGDAVTPPVIKMDRAGVITGQAFAPDGVALGRGAVRIAGEPVGLGGGFGAFPIGIDGHYRIDKLGPYEWPLLFEAYGQAKQWSGGEADRDKADRVKVVAGGTTTYDYRLEAGVTVTVTSTTAGFGGYVVARHADTGDIVGTWSIVEPNAGVTAKLIGGQRIRFEYHSGGEGGWQFVGGEDFASASEFKIHRHKDSSFELTLA